MNAISTSSLRVQDLRCEYQLNPLGIDIKEPRLSWKLDSESTHISSPHQVHYIASKGGVDALTRALALSLAPYRIRVNAVAPLGTPTAINANVEEQNQAWERSGVGPISRYIPLGE